MEGRLAQIMPTPGSMTDQMLALTEVPRVEYGVSLGLHPKRNKAQLTLRIHCYHLVEVRRANDAGNTDTGDGSVSDRDR